MYSYFNEPVSIRFVFGRFKDLKTNLEDISIYESFLFLDVCYYFLGKGKIGVTSGIEQRKYY